LFAKREVADVATRSTRSASDADRSPTIPVAVPGLFTTAGVSAARAAADAAAEQRELAAALRRSYRRQRNYRSAALSEPLTAAVLQPLADRGWRVLHDRRWPGSSRANVDHLVVWYGGVAIIDTKHWSQPVQVRDGRLWCGDDDRHDDTVDTILRLAAAVEELLEEVSTSDPGQALGLSPVHVVPVLVFTEHSRANEFAPQVGRVLLSTVNHLPARLSRRPRYLNDAQVALVGEYLAREMPPALVEVPAQEPPPRAEMIAVPVRPRPAPPPVVEPPPDADQLFDVAELASHLHHALTRPIHDWMGFLHPAQARLVRRTFNGPARVRGPAGTGKTVVLLHRAAWLASVRAGPILVTSFVRTLPPQLGSVYRALSPDTADKVEFVAIHALARRLLARNGQDLPVLQRRVDRAYDRAWERVGRHTPLAGVADSRYWREEIDYVIKGRGLRELAEYEAVGRGGRNRSLTNAQKYSVWTLLQAYQEELDQAGTYDNNDVLSAALDAVSRHPADTGWSAVLVDEVQDLNLLGLRLCRALASDGTDALFLVGDGQQALYPGGFTLADAGISVTGRAVVLRTNYRNTRQILDSARDLVADRAFTDLDTVAEPGRQEVQILRDGPPVRHADAPHPRGLVLQLRLAMRRDAAEGIRSGDMAILCHTRAAVAYFTRALTARDVSLTPLDKWNGEPDDNVKIGTINRAKGLDFAAVYLPHLDAADPDDIEAENRYVQREYVARTRPRDRLWIGHVRLPVPGPAAEC
jgi:type II secretory pathway pseudopilin PulG